MQFNPYSEEELSSLSLLKPGKYFFEVTSSKDSKSEAGNDMIELRLKIWDETGKERSVFDYLLEAMPHKLRHFSLATGLIDKYELGSLSAQDCIKKSGKLELIVQKGKQRPEGGHYPDKNSVKDYIVEEEKDTFQDDGLTF